MLDSEEKQVNDFCGIVLWAEVPQELKEALWQHLVVWTDNPEVYFDYENMGQGLWVPQDEDQDALLDWGDLAEMGLVFALGHACLIKNAYIPVGVAGDSVGLWIGESEGYYSPENINSWIQVLRRFGFQVEGLTK